MNQTISIEMYNTNLIICIEVSQTDITFTVLEHFRNINQRNFKLLVKLKLFLIFFFCKHYEIISILFSNLKRNTILYEP